MKMYTYKDTTLNAKQWATKLGISRDAFYQRVKSAEDPDYIFDPGYHRQPKGKTQRHGKSRSNSYDSWTDMFNRCSKRRSYLLKGIKICERWQLFANFLSDMGERPKGLTLERIDNNGNYEPNNCCWATPKQQGRNTSQNRSIEYRGIKFGTLIELAESVGIDYSLLRMRLHRGTPLDRALLKRDLRKGS